MNAKTLSKLCTASVLAMLVAGPGLAEDTQVTLMFVQTAQDIAVDPEAQTVRLIGINPQTVYFTDRPDRKAGHIPTAKFFEKWADSDADFIGQSFADVPPNASLSVYDTTDESNDIVVLELLDPKTDGNDVVYHYTIVDGEMPASGGHAALFIDTIGPGGGVGRGVHGVGVGARGPGVTGWAGAAARDCAATGC
jgi:hypothetical protein